MIEVQTAQEEIASLKRHLSDSINKQELREWVEEKRSRPEDIPAKHDVLACFSLLEKLGE